jgi:hypothetical protein
MDTARALYLGGTNGRAFGRPVLGSPSPYLLTNLALCACCGGSLQARSRSHGAERVRFYGCAGYHDRGRSVCTNRHDVPMVDADAIVLEALLDDVITPDVVHDAIGVAVQLLHADVDDTGGQAAEEVATLESECARMRAAIAAAGELAELLEGLRKRERRLKALRARPQSIALPRAATIGETARLRRELEALATDWRQVLASDPEHARPIVSQLLVGRVRFRPLERGRWEMTGEGTLAGLLTRDVFRCPS